MGECYLPRKDTFETYKLYTYSCSVDPYLFENFNTEDGDFLTAKFRAFKFPESTYVQFRGTVNVCLDKCQGVSIFLSVLGVKLFKISFFHCRSSAATVKLGMDAEDELSIKHPLIQIRSLRYHWRLSSKSTIRRALIKVNILSFCPSRLLREKSGPITLVASLV